MKNIPITARINKGSINKVKEPLLNVGKAGVYGKNTTQNPPSPAKKKGYAMASPLKSDNDPKVKIGVNKTTKSVSAGSLITGEKGNPGETIYSTGKSLKGLTKDQTDWRDKEIQKLGGLDGYHKKYGNKTKGKARVVGATPDKPDVKGPDVVTESNEFVSTQKRESNSSLDPWEVRQQSRSIKKSGKDQRQAGNKLDRINRRLGKMDPKDKVVGNKKFDRLSRKKTENANELDAFDKNMTARTRQTEVSANAANDDKFKGASIDRERGDDADGGAANIKAGNFKKEPISTTNRFQQAAKEGAASVTEDVKATDGKKNSPFFKKKSPIKMKYFK